MRRHGRLRRHRIAPSCGLLLRHVVLVGDRMLLLLGRHVARLQARPPRQAVSGGHLGVGRLLGRLDGGFGIDAVVVADRRFWRVQTRLRVGGRSARGTVQKPTSTRATATHLDQILALGLGHERLQLRRRERVDEPGLGDNQQEDLGAGEDGQFVRLVASRGRQLPTRPGRSVGRSVGRVNLSPSS